MSSGHLYVIRTREFILNNSYVYKIGRTSQGFKNALLKRFSQYPKGSEQILTAAVDDTIEAERILLRKLVNHDNIHQKCEFGTEYFEGNLSDIIATVCEVQQLFFKQMNEIKVDSIQTEGSDLTCKYCLRSYNTNLKRHVQSCKLKDDHIRCMEIELNKHVLPWDARTCRFCSYVTKTPNIKRHLKSCKARAEYQKKLEVELQLLQQLKVKQSQTTFMFP